MMSADKLDTGYHIPYAGIPTFLDRKKLVGTYSILSAYRNCPHQMGRRYVVKDLGAYVETPEAAWGNMVHTAMEQRIQVGKPLPVIMQGWEPLAAPLASHQNVKCELKLGVTKELAVDPGEKVFPCYAYADYDHQDRYADDHDAVNRVDLVPEQNKVENGYQGAAGNA